MAYTMTFKSLRAGTVYTLTIGGGNGTLAGGAQPFTTQESDDEDEFTPIRTQSGYLRIVDDSSFNWKSLLPLTDTDRPVVLTGVDSMGNSLGVLWQGFMQAQNFGGVLYGNPQEREFPVQCPLTVLEGTDINYQHTEIENFAYLLQRIVNTIDVVSGGTETDGVIVVNGSVHINEIWVEGGSDAQQWLLKRIDWQNFVSEDSDGNLSAKYNLYQCLEDMCRFWGWTARTWRNNLYLTCADDSSEQDFLRLTRSQLDTMAGGIAAGTVGNPLVNITPMGDIFASTDQNDYRQRGPNKATVNVSIDTADSDIVKPFDDELKKEMGSASWNEGTTVFNAHYTKDVLTLSRFDLTATAVSGSAAFNIMSERTSENEFTEVGDVVSIKKTYDGTTFISFEKKFEHCYHNGFFRMFADTYRDGEKYENGEYYAGNPAMIMRFGIGKTRATAKWWDGRAWQDSITTFLATIGNKKPELFTRYEIGSGFDLHYEQSSIINVSNLTGKIFIDMLGTNDSRFADNILGQKRFDLKDFRVEFRKNDTVSKTQYPNSNWYSVQEEERPSNYSYKSSNNNNVRQDFDVDIYFGGDNTTIFSPGILINPDGSYMSTVLYNNGDARPEQHLADRVTAYWATAKRKLELELRYDVVGVVTPRNKITIDQTPGHPISISHEWRDDIMKIVILEI